MDMEILNNIKSFSADTVSTAYASGSEMMQQGMALQKVQTAYATAVTVQKSRNLSTVASNVLEEAKMAGSSFYYSWKVKNKKTGQSSTIEGASIDLAMSIARNYGNCVIDIDASETASHYMIKGSFIDLETGFTCPRLFRQRKGQSLGDGMEAERQQDIVFQIGQSKAIRNAVIRSMPSWLINKAIETAKAAERSGIMDLKKSCTDILVWFDQYQVAQNQLEDYIGKPLQQWSADDVVTLRGVATGLVEKRVTVKEIFPDPEPAKTAAPETTTTKAADVATTTTTKPAAPVKEDPPFDPDPVVPTKEQNLFSKKKPAASKQDAETADFLRVVGNYKDSLVPESFSQILAAFNVGSETEITALDDRVAFIKDLNSALDLSNS